jgi:hypothetical protein
MNLLRVAGRRDPPLLDVPDGIVPHSLWYPIFSVPEARRTGELLLNASRTIVRTVACLLLAALVSGPISAMAADDVPFDQIKAQALGDKGIYFGNLHSHTAYSDGTGTPAQAFGWAKSTGMDFYTITDHAEQLSAPEWQDARAQSDAFTTNGRFAAITGFEWSGGAGHVNVLNTPWYTSSNEVPTLESLYNWIGSNRGVGQFNHPARGQSFGDFRMSGNPNAALVSAVETGNAGAGNNTYFFYDYFLKALDNGWRVAPTSNQDNHYLGTNSHRTGVVARGLTRASLAEAVASRRIYSSDDPDLEVTFKCGEDWMGSSLQREYGDYSFKVTVEDNEDIASLELVTNGGQVVARQDYAADQHFKKIVWEPRVTFNTSRAYYFVRVIERDTNDEDESHRGNQVALTAPIWLVKQKHDVSIKVQAASDIVAERPMYFNYAGKWAGGTTETGVTEPRKEWYLAEGSTWPGFEEWICIQNPGGSDAWVELTYMMQAGPNRKQALVVKAHSRATLSVNDAVGPSKDVSARVTSTRPVVVERPMYFDYGGCRGGSIGAAVPGPSTVWYLAEGATHPGFTEWLSLMNPGATDARAVITYMFAGGKTQRQDITVKAMSRRTVKVNDIVGPNRDVSATVTSQVPIIAERPMYFGVWDGGSSQYGATAAGTSWFFAEGTTRRNQTDGYFEEWLCVQNPGAEAASITLTYMFADGRQQGSRKTVGPHSRLTVMVNKEVGPDRDVSVQITSDRPVVAERPTYYLYHNAFAGGEVELGCRSGATSWYFAEGTNRDGFEEWLTLLNPGPATEATVTMMLEDGSTRDFTYSLPARSRTTLTVNGLLAL